MRRLRAVALFGILVSAATCRSATPIEYQVEPIPTVIGCDTACPASPLVEVTYLGVGGFIVTHRGAALLTGPLFSNPSIDSVAPLRFWRFRDIAPPISPDTTLIERLLPRAADEARMILVGHGHYDHTLDIPYIATRRARRAKIYGGPTVKHMLMGDPQLRADSTRLVVMQGSDVATVNRRGTWYYSDDSSYRVMALEADHAPTARLFRWGKVMFAGGTVKENLDTLPRSALDWKLGEPLAFLIDVLARGDTAPVFRVYFQDAPNTAPLGFPPRTLGGRAVDLAILCVATARNVSPPSPDSLLRVLRPKFVIAGHWESFFRPQTMPLMLNPASDVDAFMNSLVRNLPAASRWAMPLPRTTLRFSTAR
jgi:glyoxylase-like metal-dependent hydrolase (beta-lactamase superfamily II)